ncbi:MAG: hypothetical protein JJT85_02055 [Chromatiales bacterium]|nr:hypothetical protein [Chromatiales bacterium]
MAKRVQDQKPARAKDAQAWLTENIAEQKKRFQAIVKEMEELGPEREKWVEEFLHIVQTRGFNADGDRRVIIKPEQIAKKPKGPHKVIF